MPNFQSFITWVFRSLDIRVVRPGLPNRIGHLVLDFESYVKERLLQGRTRKPIYILDGREPCNQAVVEYWQDYIIIIRGKLSRLLSFLLDNPKLVDNLEHKYAYTLEGSSPCFSIEAEWGERPPLFKLKKQHRQQGIASLKKMGLPDDAWFVCIHARGGGYSPDDEAYHHYRNVAIGTYRDAVEEIVRRGGWCIRMGDPTMEPLPPMPRTIDYAHSIWKSDSMDVFLCASCRFFLGSSSGLSLVSAAFGVPSAITNTAPMGCAYSVFRKDISIPQIFKVNEVPMPFPDLLSSPLANLRYAQDIANAGASLQPNTSEEIHQLACEMLDRLDGTYEIPDGAEERQTRFRNFFNKTNYSYASPARIGDHFLRKYEYLFHSS